MYYITLGVIVILLALMTGLIFIDQIKFEWKTIEKLEEEGYIIYDVYK